MRPFAGRIFPESRLPENIVIKIYTKNVNTRILLRYNSFVKYKYSVKSKYCRRVIK